MLRFTLALASIAIVLGLVPSPIPAQDKPAVKAGQAVPDGADWALFRGNTLQTGVATSRLAEKLEVLWTFPSQRAVEGTAAIVNGVVYIGSMDDHLYAIDLATGKEKWKYKGGPIKAPVAYREGFLYVGDADGKFHCVDAAKGTKKWVFETEGEIVSGVNFAGDKMLFGSGDENLYCLSLDGKKLWEFKVAGGPVMGTPAVVGDRTFAAGCDSKLHVIDIANGKEVAALDLDGQVGAAAAVVGEQLYVGTMSNQVLAINWKKPDVAWKYEAAKRQQPFFSSAAVTDKLVVIGGRDKRVHGLDRKTGKAAWTFPTEGRVDSSPVIIGDRVCVGSLDHKLYILDLAKGTEVQKFDLGSPVMGSPAVGGGCLVIGTEKGLVYCLGAKK